MLAELRDLIGRTKIGRRPERPGRGLASAAPWTTRSRPSPRPSAPGSRPISRTSTGRSSRSSTCPRRSRARCSRATRATRARCGGCSSTSSPTTLPAPTAAAWDGAEGERAAKLYERIFLGYGDDSVAQLGGAHVACEWVSNVLTKILQRPRLGAYLEQSTRYIAYDAPMPGGRLPLLPRPELGPSTAPRWTSSSPPTPPRCREVTAWADEALPARRRRARGGPRARDQGQGARPAARAAARRLAVAHGDLRHGPDLRAAGPAPARPPAARGARLRADDPRRGQGGHAELRGPRRAARPRRRVGRLPPGARRGGASAGPRGSGSTAPAAERRAAPRCACSTSTATRSACSRRCCSRRRPPSEEQARDRRRRAVGASERAELLADLVGERRQPPPPPGPRLRGAALPLRDRLRLRRLPRPPAPPDAHLPVADADARPRRRRARGGRRGRRRATPTAGRWSARATSTSACVDAGLRARRAVRAVPRLPDPLRARPQRARGDAADRAALGARGPSRPTAPWPTRCTPRSPPCTPPWPRR